MNERAQIMERINYVILFCNYWHLYQQWQLLVQGSVSSVGAEKRSAVFIYDK
ncbi:hypothetical protein I6N96_17835 [Enterococcus sp. BWM-S5]|uniref:Uncharacterized protein n=1 Tax=Enterococcus larvae TaxID=2794352 RepID=A0ABS4CQ64_9ENTE|nr:hypothetical protein [Enterococcus larvae]MBP1048157.1 hypothetical protein [Enterococcus larvae]